MDAWRTSTCTEDQKGEGGSLSSLSSACLQLGTRWSTSASVSLLPVHLDSRAGRGAAVNLADVVANAHDQEPGRNQWAVLDGDIKVLMLACLERTAVIQLDGQRVLVEHRRLDVDETALRWQKREMTPKQAYLRQRRGRAVRSA